MANPTHDSRATDALVTSAAIGQVAADLLHAHWDELPAEKRAEVLELLARRADGISKGVQDLVRLGDGHRERIDALEADVGARREQIDELEAAALSSEAAALVSDARIQELAAEVDRLLAERDQAAVVDQAKRAIMTMMHVSEDAAFAVLVAAAERDGMPLHTLAQQVTNAPNRLA